MLQQGMTPPRSGSAEQRTVSVKGRAQCCFNGMGRKETERDA